MATRTALHIQSAKNLVEPKLFDWMKSVHQTSAVLAENHPELLPFAFLKNFICSEEIPPTMLAVCQTQPDWVTIHYNSFYNMSDFAAEISGNLDCLAVIAVMQSVTDCNYLSIHDNGKHLRTLETVGLDWIKQEGEPLPFETKPLGTKRTFDNETYYIFGDYELEEYCAHFGLEVWMEEGEDWTILSVPNELYTEQIESINRLGLPQKRGLTSRLLRLFGFALY